MSNTILVTGATGNIGRELVQALQAAGANIIAGSSSGKPVAGVPTRQVDFNDVAGMTTAMSGVDTLFLLLPLGQSMWQLAHNAISAAKAAGVKHIVRSSGAGADAQAGFALPKTQGEIDALVIESGIAYTLLRPNSFMQNFATYYAGMVQGGTIYLPQGEGASSYIDVRDIASVAATVLTNPTAHVGKVYTLTGGEALTNAQAVALIGAAIDKPVNYVSVPDAAAVESMKGMGMDDWTIGQMMSLNQIITLGYAAAVSDDVTKLLGRAPIAFAQFAKDYAQAWK